MASTGSRFGRQCGRTFGAKQTAPSSSGRFSLIAEEQGKTVARPTKYKAEYAKQAAKLCKLGATDPQLADFFGVAVSTVGLWKVQHKEFSDAVKVPKAEADERVEQSLYRRALGYEHDEVDIRVVGGEVVMTEVRKHYPPDPTAMIFWLKNRKPGDWRDKQDVEHSGDLIVKINRLTDGNRASS